MRTILISLILAGISSAEVPSLINYQGRLTGPGGAPASGTKNFALKIYDATTDGTLLYSEDVGAITLGEGGVYSFRFGGSGTSNTLVTETVGTGTDAVLYQKVLSNTPVVAGSVSVSDGTYTWSQAGGSSNEDDFNASFSTNLNRITVNYFAGAPDDSRQIEVTYRYGAAGIVGALSSGSGHWLQLSIDGEVQATRERVLAVPFALRAGVAEKTNKGIQFGDYEVRDPNKLNYEPTNGFLIVTGETPQGQRLTLTVSMGNNEDSLSRVFHQSLGLSNSSGQKSITLPIKAKTYWSATEVIEAKFISIE
jgi:hypothetical protein